MDKRAHGGFSVTDKSGQVILGQGGFNEDDTFSLEVADKLVLNHQPHEAIVQHMADRGLWGSYIVANNLTKENDTERLI